jgi:hypothetical protein
MEKKFPHFMAIVSYMTMVNLTIFTMVCQINSGKNIKVGKY